MVTAPSLLAEILATVAVKAVVARSVAGKTILESLDASVACVHRRRRHALIFVTVIREPMEKLSQTAPK